MKRRIDMTVTGCLVEKSSKTAGAQGEGNATSLRMKFDESWRGLGKRIIWRDAQGGNPVAVVLYDPEAASDTLQYGTLIPGEPLSLPGWCSATIEGYTTDADGVLSVSRTAEFRLQVLLNDGLYAPAEPTPTEASQIYDLLGKTEMTMQGYVDACQDAAAACGEQMEELAEQTAANRTYADRCKFYADATQHTATGLAAVEEAVAELQVDLSNKLDANPGSEYDGMVLTVDQNGSIVPGYLGGGGLVTSVCGEIGAVKLTTDHLQHPDGENLTQMLNTLDAGKADRWQSAAYAGKLWAVGENGGLCFVDSVPVDDTLSQWGVAADAAAVGQCLGALPVQVAADGYTELAGCRKVTGLNLSMWDEGTFAVTLDGGVTAYYLVAFDQNHRPVTVTDETGHVTQVLWG